MEHAAATTAAPDADIVRGKDLEDFVTFFINDQMFGIPVLKVQDILTPDRIAPIPLAPTEVRGSINLRGRIVTVVDVRVRLDLDERVPEKAAPAAKESRRPEEVSPPPADKSAHPPRDESAAEGSRVAEEGNGAAEKESAPLDEGAAAPGAPGGSADAVERPANDENRSAEGASPTEDGGNGAADYHGMCVTVEHQNELYTLLVDRVGDVISLSDEFYEDNPSTLDAVWREFALGVYRLQSALMVVLDVGRLLDIKSARD